MQFPTVLIFNHRRPLRIYFCAKRLINGENRYGKKSFFHRGGGIQSFYLLVDMKRYFLCIPGLILGLSFDIIKKKTLSFVAYANGFLLYQLSVHLVGKGSWIYNGFLVPRFRGNTLFLSSISRASMIFNISLSFFRVGSFARAEGTSGHILKKYHGISVVRLPSGEERIFVSKSVATLGSAMKSLLFFFKKGKAGINRLLGKRPVVRGIAMNPVDHPHGGRTSGGRPSVTPWAVYTKGVKTQSKFSKHRKCILRTRFL